VARSTAAGYRTLTAETLTVHEGGDERATAVPPADGPDVLRTHFGLAFPPN
jgi:hypothetical protein